MRATGLGELLGEAALEAERGELGSELDDDRRVGEAAQNVGAIPAAGDEQEGQARRQPQQEAEEVGSAALGQRRDVAGAFRLNGRHGAAQCAAPQLGPVPISTPSGTDRLTAGSAALSMTRRITTDAASTSPAGSSNTSSSCTWRSMRTWPSPASASAGPMRTIARLMRSADVPWIGALIACRSAAWRSPCSLPLMPGSQVLRPNSVTVWPCSRTADSVSAM